MTADPGMVESARILEVVSYNEVWKWPIGGWGNPSPGSRNSHGGRNTNQD